MKIPRAEQETHVWYAPTDDVALVYSEEPAVMRQLRKVAETWGVSVGEVGDYGVRVALPKGALKFARKRATSDRQRANLRVSPAKEAV